MIRRISIVVGSLFAIAGAIQLLHAQQQAADLVLSNGKIITVDDRFTIAQAVAITGDRNINPTSSGIM